MSTTTPSTGEWITDRVRCVWFDDSDAWAETTFASAERRLATARATAARREGDGVVVECEDGRVVRASHAVLAIGSVPNSEGLGLEAAGVALEFVPAAG